MRRVVVGEGDRRTPGPGAPVAEVLLGDADSPVAVLAVTVPAGGRMPSHDHGQSSVVLIPLSGVVEVSTERGDGPVELAPGTAGAVEVGERVELANTGNDEARLMVIVSPPDFARSVQAWPSAAQ